MEVLHSTHMTELKDTSIPVTEILWSLQKIVLPYISDILCEVQKYLYLLSYLKDEGEA